MKFSLMTIKSSNLLKIHKILILLFLISFYNINLNAQTNWYVNDGSQTDDVYTSGAGSAGGNGSIGNPFNNVAAAISAASNGDFIYVDTGNYSDTNINFNKEISLVGAGTTNSIFDGGNSNNRFGLVSSNNVSISGIKILDYFLEGTGQAIFVNSNITGFQMNNIVVRNLLGAAAQGSSIYLSSGSSSTFTSLVFGCSGFNGGSGGGIKVDDATLVADNCIFKDTWDFDGKGGAIDMFGTFPNVTVTNSSFLRNLARRGGAIHQSSGALSVTGSCFDSNIVNGDSGNPNNGGAHFGAEDTPSNSTTTFSNCTFTNAIHSGDGNSETPSGIANTNGSNDGKGIQLEDCNGSFNFDTCTFNNFTANGLFDNGLDIYFEQGSNDFDISIINCTFGNDQTSTDGSDAVNIYNVDVDTARVTITDCGTRSTTNTDGVLGNGYSYTGNTPTEPSTVDPSSIASTSCFDLNVITDCDATINCATETTPPVIINPVSNQTLDGSMVACTMQNYIPLLAVYDDCTVNITQSPAEGTALIDGVQTVTFTVTDQNNNTTMSTFDLTVTNCSSSGGGDAQLAIGKTSVEGAAIIDFASGYGIILPWIGTPGASDENGTLIFDTTDNKVKGRINGAWVDLSENAGTLDAARTNAVTNHLAKTEKIGEKVIIGATTSTANGALILESTDKALILPKMASPHLNMIDPEPGTIVYDTDADLICVFNGSEWTFWGI